MKKFEEIRDRRLALKRKFRSREAIFAGWVSFDSPSITETFAETQLDLILIDMEHSTISLEQAQRIIAASQGLNTPCIPRPVSHSNEYIKPILDSGADGILLQMAETPEDVKGFIDLIKYPPAGKRTYGINRGQGYGFHSSEYFESWNHTSVALLQVESVTGVENINAMLEFEEIDGVMIGPYDLSGSLGVPGELDHPLVKEASKSVIEACEKAGKSCGFQIAAVTETKVRAYLDEGFNFIILSSDLFVLWDWASATDALITRIKSDIS